MAENRVRIIIEAPPEQAVQGVSQVGAALDGLGAKGQQAGETAGAGLTRVTTTATELGTQGSASVGLVGGALAQLGSQSQSAGTALASVTAQAVDLGRQGQTAIGQVGVALETLGGKGQLVGESLGVATVSLSGMGQQGEMAVGQTALALETLGTKGLQVGETVNTAATALTGMGMQGERAAGQVAVALNSLGATGRQVGETTGAALATMAGKPQAAIGSLTEFRHALETSGATAKLTDDQLCRLADRFRDKLAADRSAEALNQARQQIERIGQAAGLSQQEIAKLSRQLGAMPSGGGLQSVFSGVSGGASEIAATSSAMESLALKVGAVVAAYISLREVAGFLSDSIMSAARYQTLGVVIEKVGENAGYTKEQMQSFADGVQKSGISMNESREALAKMATAQLDLSKSAALARVAQDAAVISNSNSSETFGRLVQGITTGQTILLHHAGIMVNLESAYKKYATQIGVAKDELTDAEKRMVALNAVLDEGAQRTGAYEAAMGTAGKQIQSFKRYVDDFKTSLGDAFLDSFTGVVFDASDSMQRLQEVIKDPATQAVLSQMAEGLASVFKAVIDGAPGAVKAFVDAINAIKETWNSLDPGIKLFFTYGPAVSAGAVVGSRFGPVGTVVGAAGGAWAASGFENPLAKMGGQLLKDYKILQAGYAVKTATTPEEKSQAQAVLDTLTAGYNKVTEAANAAGEATKKVPPTKEEAAAANSYWAAYNKGMREYTELRTKGLLLREKNKSHAPIETQKKEAKEAYESEQSTIAKVSSAAWAAKDWALVREMNDAASASLGNYNDKLDSLDRKANRGAKSAQSAANAAARYGEQANAYLDQALNLHEQLEAQLNGDKLGAKIDQIDSKYDKLAHTLEKAKIGAKGSTANIDQAEGINEQNRALEKQVALQRAAQEAAKQSAALMRTLGDLTTDPDTIRAGHASEIQEWATEQKRQAKGVLQDKEQLAQREAMIDQVVVLKMAQNRMDTAKSFEEYYSTYINELSGKDKWKSQDEREIWQRSLQEYLSISQEMVAVRMATYDQILTYAEKSGNAELARYAQVVKEEAALKDLQNTQKYGSNSDAFWATMSINYGGYKSEMTRAREDYVALANDIKTLTDGMFDGIGTAFSGIVKGIATGSLDIQSIWSTLLTKMGDLFMDFAMQILKRWYKDIIANMFSSSTSSSGTSGLGSILSSLFGLGSSSSASSAYTSSAESTSAMASVGVSPWTSAWGTGFAHGGAFTATTGLPLNSILSSPTFFPIADNGYHPYASGGLGVAGEAGEEALMPLKRMSDNNLGVRVDMGQSNSQDAKPTHVNATVPVKVINVWDMSMLGQYIDSPEGEKKIVNIMRRNGS